MASFPTSPAQFVATTKAKAAEVNAKFNAVRSSMTDGTNDFWINGLYLTRLSNGNVDVTSNCSYINAYHTIDSATTYKLKDSSSRMVIFGVLTVNDGGLLDATSGSELLVV